jgi:uncharacterized damage-inducible protein DinB
MPAGSLAENAWMILCMKRQAMIDANYLANAFARNVMVVKMQSEGLSQADSLRRPTPHSNCLNWVLGHIVVSREDVLETLGVQPAADAELARYKRGSEPLADGEEALALDSLLERLDRAQERIAAALGSTDAAAFAQDEPSGSRKMTVGQRLVFLYFHESYHVGQTELFRQLAGKSEKLI